MDTRIITENNKNIDLVFLENYNLKKYDDETILDWASECEDDIYLETPIGDKEIQENIYEYYNNIYNKIPQNIRDKLNEDEWFIHLTKLNTEWICFQHIKIKPLGFYKEGEMTSLIIDIANDRFCIYDWEEYPLDYEYHWQSNISLNLLPNL